MDGELCQKWMLTVVFPSEIEILVAVKELPYERFVDSWSSIATYIVTALVGWSLPVAHNERDVFDILDCDLHEIQASVLAHVEQRILEGSLVASVVNDKVIVHALQDVIAQPTLQYA